MLTISQLSKTYPDGTRALQAIDLQIGRGMFGLLGPNGAGKSTLMRTLATLQSPSSGRIDLDGMDWLADLPRSRRLLGYLPQEFGVYPRISALAMLDHLAIMKGLTQARQRRVVVEGLLRQVNLWQVRAQKLGTYSGGMRQRLGIAQALLGQPRLMMVDEPTAGLDPEERHRFLNLLAEISERVIVILSTHIVQDVTDLCQQMAIIGHGQMLYSGRPGDAMAQLRGKVWRRQVATEHLDGYRARLSILSTRLVAGQTLLHVLAEHAPDASFEAIEPDLEDVYFWHLRRHAQTEASTG